MTPHARIERMLRWALATLVIVGAAMLQIAGSLTPTAGGVLVAVLTPLLLGGRDELWPPSAPSFRGRGPVQITEGNRGARARRAVYVLAQRQGWDAERRARYLAIAEQTASAMRAIEAYEDAAWLRDGGVVAPPGSYVMGPGGRLEGRAPAVGEQRAIAHDDGSLSLLGPQPSVREVAERWSRVDPDDPGEPWDYTVLERDLADALAAEERGGR